MSGNFDLRVRVPALDISKPTICGVTQADSCKEEIIYLEVRVRFATNTAVEVSLMSKPEYEISTPATQLPHCPCSPS